MGHAHSSHSIEGPAESEVNVRVRVLVRNVVGGTSILNPAQFSSCCQSMAAACSG